MPSSFIDFLLYLSFLNSGNEKLQNLLSWAAAVENHRRLWNNFWGYKLLLETQNKLQERFRITRSSKCFHRRKQLLSFSTGTKITGTDLIFKMFQKIFIS
jgi:hypothetical protein